jgi:N-acetylmuramoyl-L-alanine amidase
MGLRARLLHILAAAPVAAIVAAALGPSAYAQSSDSQTPPAPVVVVIDPGHGGTPNSANPAQPFDPGAIAPGGLMEKDVTLDVGLRVAQLLRQDLVDVVLTRSTDVGLSTAQREQIGIDAHENLFVSIHCNSYPADPTVDGSLVLYPNSQSQPFAQALEDALGRDLVSYAVPDQGTVLRDNWWIHNPAPTGTVEMAYLSNPREASLMATEAFRAQVAVAIRDGIESFDPQIALKRAQIIAWDQRHPAATPPAHPTHRATSGAAPRTVKAQSSGFPLGTVAVWLVIVAMLVAVLRWRTPIARVLRPCYAQLHRAAARRRRQQLRLRRLTVAGERRWPAYSVYDELPL